VGKQRTTPPLNLPINIRRATAFFLLELDENQNQPAAYISKALPIASLRTLPELQSIKEKNNKREVALPLF